MSHAFFALAFLCFSAFQAPSGGMLVKDWGTDSQAQRLAWSTKSFFEEVHKLITLGQWSVFPISGFSSTFQVQNPFNPKDTTRAVIYAYNGWLENLQLNSTGTSEVGKLRRFIMTTAEKHVHEKDTMHASMKDHSHHHEIIICDECLALQANGFHFGYEASLEKPDISSWGTYDKDDPISFMLSFKLTLMTSHNKTTLKRDCITTLDSIKVSPHPVFWVKGATAHELIIKSGTFSFLADKIHDMVADHFNTTFVNALQGKINGFANSLAKTNNMCRDFLSGGIFVNVDDYRCN